MAGHTTKETIALLKKLGVCPKKSLGQNFLVNPNLCQKIIQQIEASRVRRLIEVGPGLGYLTEGLKTVCLDLILIEKDNILADFLRQKGFCVLNEDALHADWSHLIADHTVLVSNLPYQIASRLLVDRSLDAKPLEQVILMFQREVAMRILAKPKSKSYGLLSVMAQTYWRISKVLEAGPKDFYPHPAVASQVLSFVPKACPDMDSKLFLAFLKVGFSQRRKQLFKLLISSLKVPKINKKDLQNTFKDLDVPLKARPEDLAPHHWVDLFLALSL